MVQFAFSLQDQVEKYGAYIGIAAFFGLAVLTLLYFAQAREVKRLREWAGRAPERAAELEQAVAEHAEEVRRTPVPAPQQVAQPQPAVANGAVKLTPAEVAALAFARAAGVRDPHEPKPHPAPVPAATVAAPKPPSRPADIEPAPPAPIAAAAAAVATGEPAAAQALAPATNGGGSGTAPPKPPPATPAARRPEPAPLPPRRTTPPSRRQVTPPPRRETNTRAVVLTAVIGILVLAGTAFAITSMLGGDDDPQQPAPPVASVPPDEAEPTASAEPVTKDNAQVMVYNGTSVEGLAGRYEGELQAEAYPDTNVEVATLAEAEQRQTSTVMFRNASARKAAEDVASVLGIEQVERLDAATQASLADLPESQQKDWNVVVIVGVDKSTQ